MVLSLIELTAHRKWIDCVHGGERLILHNANLQSVNLYRADLSSAIFTMCDLECANLAKTQLDDAQFSGSNLRGAVLRCSNLERADLTRCNLRGADLRDAQVLNATFEGVQVDEDTKLPPFQICPEQGSFVAWKSGDGRLIKLLVPEGARRTSCIGSRKCRAEFVKVLEIEGGSDVMTNGLGLGALTTYGVGKTVQSDSYNDDWRVACSHGIHFFVTKDEALNWAVRFPAQRSGRKP